MRGLYAIVDVTALGHAAIDPLAFARRVLAAFPAALQVRAKDVSASELLSLLRAIAPLARAAAVPLVCNDRPDVAVEGGADMVHLGQDDEPIESVRKRCPGLRVGISTHDLSQIENALARSPDYVAYGPIFATGSKANPDPVVGIEGLRAASAVVRKTTVPLVAIGGISLEHAFAIAPLADCAAVIGDLVRAADTAAHARALHEALGGS